MANFLISLQLSRDTNITNRDCIDKILHNNTHKYSSNNDNNNYILKIINI